MSAQVQDSSPHVQKPTQSRTGRRPKGGGIRRAQTTVRYPEDHKLHYEREADELGLSLSDYFAYIAATARGLTVPNYILDQIAASAADREAARAAVEVQDQLPQAS